MAIVCHSNSWASCAASNCFSQLVVDTSVPVYALQAAVAPLFSGAGVKGKVNEAMKFGVPVVATSLAVEGMGATAGVNCLVADGHKEMAAALLRLEGGDCSTWARLAAGGLESMWQKYSMEAARPALMHALMQVAGLKDVALKKCAMAEDAEG